MRILVLVIAILAVAVVAFRLVKGVKPVPKGEDAGVSTPLAHPMPVKPPYVPGGGK